MTDQTADMLAAVTESERLRQPRYTYAEFCRFVQEAKDQRARADEAERRYAEREGELAGLRSVEIQRIGLNASQARIIDKQGREIVDLLALREVTVPTLQAQVAALREAAALIVIGHPRGHPACPYQVGHSVREHYLATDDRFRPPKPPPGSAETAREPADAS